MNEWVFQISSPYFTAGGVIGCPKGELGNRVVEAAPVIKYMIGWGQTEVFKYCSKKEWKLTILDRSM